MTLYGSLTMWNISPKFPWTTEAVVYYSVLLHFETKLEISSSRIIRLVTPATSKQTNSTLQAAATDCWESTKATWYTSVAILPYLTTWQLWTLRYLTWSYPPMWSWALCVRGTSETCSRQWVPGSFHCWCQGQGTGTGSNEGRRCSQQEGWLPPLGHSHPLHWEKTV